MTITPHTVTALIDLLRDAARLMEPGPHEGCPCEDGCRALGTERREIRPHLLDAIAELEADIAHAALVAKGSRLTFTAPERTEES